MKAKSEPEHPGAEPDGVDPTLIRWMLALSPGERLDVLQKHVDAVEALSGAGKTTWISERSSPR